ncbi:MAG TPA: hypothetical protein PLL18_02455 [Flavobacteriales bacterium]|nr:hypothetical protein [Flavobacteriales bacterium]
MPRFRSRLLIATFPLLAVLGQACRKDRPQPQWDVDALVPLVKVSLSINDLVPDSLLSADSMGNVSLLYSTELFTLSLDTVLTAPDTSFRYTYALPFPGPVQFPPGTTFNTNDDVSQFDLAPLELTSLIVRSGQLDVVITNMMNGHIIGNVSLPGASLDGAPFQVEMPLPPGSPSNPSTTSASRPLDGYSFDLRGPGLNAVNSLATHLSYANSPDGSTISITNQDSLLATVSYHGIIPQYASGSFGTRSLSIDPSTAELDLFRNISGTIDLAQVDARLKVRNGIGVDARANLLYLRSRNTSTGNEIALNAPITNGPLNIDRAIDLGHSFQAASNTFHLGQGNSNIDQFLENLPDKIDYALDVTINPLGNISNGHDFLYHDSKLNATLEVEIPLRLIATNLVLGKTLDVDLPGSEDAHAWRSGTLHLFATNGFPLSAEVQLAVAGPNGQVISLLGPGGTVAPAQLGPGNTVVAPSASRVDFRISADQMNMIHHYGKLQATVVFNTADQGQHTQILESYRMDLQITLAANYMVNGDE